MDSQRRLPRPWVCGSLELTACARRSSSRLGSPVERVRLLIFAPTFPMGHAFCLTRLVMCFVFSLSSLCPDIRSKEHTSLFCLLASISLRITWEVHLQVLIKAQRVMILGSHSIKVLRQGSKELDSSSPAVRSSSVILRFAQDLSRSAARSFASLRMTRCDCSNGQVHLVQIEPCLKPEK